MALILQNADQVDKFISEREAEVMKLLDLDEFGLAAELKSSVTTYCASAREIISGMISESEVAVEFNNNHFNSAKNILFGTGENPKGKLDVFLALAPEDRLENIKKYLKQIGKLVIKARGQIEAYLWDVHENGYRGSSRELRLAQIKNAKKDSNETLNDSNETQTSRQNNLNEITNRQNNLNEITKAGGVLAEKSLNSGKIQQSPRSFESLDRKENILARVENRSNRLLAGLPKAAELSEGSGLIDEFSAKLNNYTNIAKLTIEMFFEAEGVDQIKAQVNLFKQGKADLDRKVRSLRVFGLTRSQKLVSLVDNMIATIGLIDGEIALLEAAFKLNQKDAEQQPIADSRIATS